MTEQELKETALKELKITPYAAKCKPLNFFAKQLNGLTTADLHIYAPEIPIITRVYKYNTDVYYCIGESSPRLEEFNGLTYVATFFDVNVSLRYDKLDTLIGEKYFQTQNRPYFVLMKGKYDTYGDSSLFDSMLQSAKEQYLRVNRERIYNYHITINRANVSNCELITSTQTDTINAKAVLAQVKAQSGRTVYVHLGTLYDDEKFILNYPIFKNISGNGYVAIFDENHNRIWLQKKFLKGYCC